eukprot:20578-Heterococcus_DN1.PRE.4
MAFKVDNATTARVQLEHLTFEVQEPNAILLTSTEPSAGSEMLLAATASGRSRTPSSTATAVMVTASELPTTHFQRLQMFRSLPAQHRDTTPVSNVSGYIHS